MRLFVGVPPGKEACEAAAGYIGAARELWPGAKWVPAQNLHYTLVFIGYVDEAAARRIAGALDEAVAPAAPFRMALGGPGRFPPKGRARVLWIGAREGEEELGGLARRCEEALLPWVEPEGRPFAAHLTVARFREPNALDDEALPRVEPSGSWTVDEVILYESRLGRPAPVYEAFHRSPLLG